MRNLCVILFFCCIIPVITDAQGRTLSGSARGKTGDITNNRDTVSANQHPPRKEVTVKSVIRAWTLENQSSLLKPVVLDTVFEYFHNYTPIYKQNISNTYLGYLGAPYISNLFFDRLNCSDYYFQRSFQAYRQTQDKVKYYNTTTPYSALTYTQGTVEQTFSAGYSQNIDSVTNIGFRFNVLKNVGQYKNAEANHRNLNVFFSRNSQRYNGYFSFITGTDRSQENGGITDSIVSVKYTPSSLPVNLNNPVSPTIKTFSLFTSHEYLLGGIPFLFKDEKADSGKFISQFGALYSFKLDNYKRSFYESGSNNSFFDTTFFSSASHTDSSTFRRITQIVQLRALENPKRKFTFGKRVYAENEIVMATHPVPYGTRKYNYSNLYVGGEISNYSNHFLKWSALARFAVLGRNFGDALLKGTLDKPIKLFNDTVQLVVSGWYQDISPDIYQEHWQDNHYKWENQFKKQHEVVVNGTINWDKINLHAGGNYAMLGNYIYNGGNAMPAQFSGAFSILSIWLNKEFRLGPLGWNNKVAWQQSSNNTVLHVPALNYYTCLYFKGVLFKVMKYQFGAEMYYNTKFYADSYNPSTTQFYIQDKVLTGGYPQLNAFVNAKLKRTNAFAQLMNFNSYFSDGKFFSSASYPINQMAFIFGFIWSFYD